MIVTDETLDLVARNIDLALRGGAPGSVGLVARKLGAGQLGLYASPQYATENIQGDVLNSLSGHVVFDPSQRGKEVAATEAPRSRIETRNFELAKALAVHSQGIALLPNNLCVEQIQSGQLIEVEFTESLPSLAVYMVMPSRHHMPGRVRALIDFLVSEHSREEIV